MVASKHAIKAIKKRLGLPKRSVVKRLEEAVIHGLHHKGLKGRLKRYVDYLWFKYEKAGTIIIHNNFVFIGNNGVLITMYGLPHNLRRQEAGNKK